jgi:hypothetical protein
MFILILSVNKDVIKKYQDGFFETHGKIILFINSWNVVGAFVSTNGMTKYS